jgi:hypothetical protein
MDQRLISKLMKKLENLSHGAQLPSSFISAAVVVSCLLPALPLLRAIAVACQCACERHFLHYLPLPCFHPLSSSIVLSSPTEQRRDLFFAAATSRRISAKTVTVPFSLEPGAWSCHPRCPEPSAAALPVELGHVHRPALIGEGATARLSS